MEAMNGAFETRPMHFYGTLDVRTGEVKFIWAWPDARVETEQVNRGNPSSGGVVFQYAVMDETTHNAKGKRCTCWDYVPNQEDTSKPGTCAEALDCSYNPVGRGWFIKVRAPS